MLSISLFENIQSKVHISKKDYDAFENFFEKTSIKKNDILISEGNKNDKLYFIEKGIVYFYKILDDGCIQVIQFSKENYWVTDLSSFFNASNSLFSIKAIEDCKLLYITKENYEKSCLNSISINTYFRLNIQNAYSATLQLLSDVYAKDAESKYEYFIKHFFEISQRVPQYLIASYLGILPSSLSRIRNKKLKK